MLRTASRLVALGSFLIAILAAANATAAPDAHAVAAALVAAFNANGKFVASYADAAANGDTITITGFKAVQPKRTGRDLTIATIVIAGAAERQPGGFTAASMTFNDGSATYRRERVTWQSAIAANAVIPTAEEIQTAGSIFVPFTTASINGVTISNPYLVQPANVAKVDIATTADDQGHLTGVTANTKDVHVPTSAFVPEIQGALQSVGYTDLVLSASADAGFDTGADTVTLHALTVDVADVGKLTISGALSHLKVRDLLGIGAAGQAKAKQLPDINGLTVSFQDAGVVNRALDMQAQIVGMTREDMANQWPMLLMFLIGNAGSMDFQQKVQTALTDFLMSPKSLTVTLAPPAPVPFDTVAKTFDKDQKKLPELLGIDIAVDK